MLSVVLLLANCVSTEAGDNGRDRRAPSIVADELIAADRAFSAGAATLDITTALLTMFDDSVHMMHPAGFTNSRQEATALLSTNAANATSRMSWTPIRAGVSSDGKHGFTQGYIEMTRGDGTVVPGKYLAYWVRRPAGWRVLVYKRSGRPAGVVSLAQLPNTLPTTGLPQGDSADVSRFAAELRAAESAFSDDAMRIGIGPAFRNWGMPDAVNAGGGASWILGNEAIGADHQPLDEGESISWGSDIAATSATGDLGYSVGRITLTLKGDASPRVVTFFTVWKRLSSVEPWRYIAE